MAKRRRRRLWYEVEPRDPRLWLYGPVPSGFWDLAENRQRYVEWLGEQLGFTKLEDWYRIVRQEAVCVIVRHGASRDWTWCSITSTLGGEARR